MRVLERLLEQNKNWAKKIKESDPEFFSRLAKQQSPELLWIGCSDSRVPANQIIDVAPGRVFVHRNVANLVVANDINCLSVVQFAVEVLNVKHIIICGHYGCGGVQAALNNESRGLITDWLRHIKYVYEVHRDEIDKLADDKQKINRMCELNVIAQVNNLCHTTVIKNAWEGGQALSVHGWIYRIEDGILRDLDVCITSNEELPDNGTAL